MRGEGRRGGRMADADRTLRTIALWNLAAMAVLGCLGAGVFAAAGRFDVARSTAVAAAAVGVVVPAAAAPSSFRLSLERYSAVTVEPTDRPAAPATSCPTSTSPWAGQEPWTSQCPLSALTRSTSMPATMYGLLLTRTVS